MMHACMHMHGHLYKQHDAGAQCGDLTDHACMNNILRSPPAPL